MSDDPVEQPDPTVSRPFSDLRNTGLLWYINRVCLHPHGLAMAVDYDETTERVIGWHLLEADDGVWAYTHEDDELCRRKLDGFLESENFTRRL